MPKVIDIKVGYTCNNKCVHCAIDHMKSELLQQNAPIDRTFDQIKALIDDNRDADMFTITGGEPTVRKDFHQILSYIDCIKKPNAIIQVQTNGRKLKEQYLEGINSNIVFAVAVHGSQAQIHDAITQTRHSFDQTIQGVKLLTSLHRHIVIKIVINKLNYNDLGNIIALLNNLNVHYVNIAFPHGIGSAWDNNIVPKYNDVIPHLLKALDLCDQYGMDVDVEAVPFCLLGKHMEKSSALKTQIFNVDVAPVARDKYNWNKAHNDEMYKDIHKCNHCSLNCVCEGVWQDYINRYHQLPELTPITFNLQQSQINKHTLKLLSNIC